MTGPVVHIITPEAFGAVGDGVADDSAAIQQALNSGYIVIFDSNKTYLADGLDAPANAKVIAGRATIVGISDTYIASLASNAEWLGGIFTPSASQQRVIKAENADNVCIRNIEIPSATNALTGIYIVDCDDILIENNKISNVRGTGILIKPTADNIRRAVIRNNTLDTIATDGAPFGGIYFNSGDIYIVEDSITLYNKITNAGYVGLFLGGDRNKDIGSIVTGSGAVTAASGYGVWVHDSADIQLIGTSATSGANSGIQVDKSRDVIVSGCYASLNDGTGFRHTYGAGASGRYQNDDANKHVTFTGCMSINNSQGSIGTWPGFFVDGGNYITFTGNIATDNQSTKTQDRGLVAATNINTSNMIITGNNFVGNISGFGVNVSNEYKKQSLGNSPNYGDFFSTNTNNIGAGGGTRDIDLNIGKSVKGTVDTSETTFTFSNFAPIDDSFILYLTNGGSQTVNWPASVQWDGGTPPTLTVSGLDVLEFKTPDGGTTVFGFVQSQDVS